MPPTLKPIDVVVLAELIFRPADRQGTQSELARKLRMSQPSIHRSLKQLTRSGLWRDGHPQRSAFHRLIVYAVQYVFPAELGAPCRGVPTANPGAGLVALRSEEPPYVWPSEDGDAHGPALIPLHPSVPIIALEDSAFHELLALVDTFRVGRTRERGRAEQRLVELLDLRT